jgi:hypothetical protein
MLSTLIDRWRDSQWRATLRPAPADDPLPAPVLNVCGRRAVRGVGPDVETMMARLHVEARERGVALLAPHRRGWSLDFWTSEARFAMPFRRRRAWSGEPTDPDPAWLDAVLVSGVKTGARLVHVEGLDGLSLASARELAGGPAPLVLTMYDTDVGGAPERALVSAILERAAAVVVPTTAVGGGVGGAVGRAPPPPGGG